MYEQTTKSTVSVGAIDVLDEESATLIDILTNSAQKKRTAYAMHVGALHSLSDRKYLAAMQAADIVYADGAAVVLLARVAGGKRINRAATTDIGIPLLLSVADALQRPVRVVIVGGKPGVAEGAASNLEAISPQIEVVLSTHGYHDSYSEVFEQIRMAAPDVVIVGLGMPYEAKWVAENYDHLPDALIFTCGGWLGFLAGDEKRAPEWMQRNGFEWLFRLYQSPRRLWYRYAMGLALVVRLLPVQVKLRSQV
jgi:N-acetylglucosaminyldiphosphoundecaprenol N-acetyl-beta-D-mannosaminyltransferase